MAEFAERFWTASDGVRLHARDYAGVGGEARLPVFCIHGLTRNARDFEALAPWIAERGRRVVVIDVRGRGESGWTADPMRYVLPVYVEDVIGWAAALGVGRALFVGTSMGGIITMGVAGAAPELIGGAVLNDIGPEIGEAGLARIGGYISGAPDVDDWSKAADYARAQNADAFPDYGDAQWDAFARRVFRERDGRVVLDYDHDICVPMRDGSAGPAPDLWPLFDALANAGPLLVVRGATSDILEAQVATAMKGRRSTMTLIEIPGRGHAPALDEPDALAAMDRWLAEAP